MGCDKSCTKEDRIVHYGDRECFGPFFGLQAEGPKGLPDLVISQSDHLDIDEKRNELYIFRPGHRAPIGVAFEHTLATGSYSGFSPAQVARAKNAILAGRLQEFHFIADATLKGGVSPPFPEPTRRAIEQANAILIAHHMTTSSDCEFSPTQVKQLEAAILAGRMWESLFVGNATFPSEKFPGFSETTLQAVERARAALIGAGKDKHLISYHSVDYRRQVPLSVWTPPDRRGPPTKSIHHASGHPVRSRTTPGEFR